MASIKKEVVNGVFWTAIEKYSGVIVSLLVTAVMARLLSPADFGVVAIATVLINFLSIFATMGIGPAIIQKRGLSDEDINSIYSFSVCIGVFFSIVFFASSWGVAVFYGNPQLVIVCQFLSLNLFFASANMVPNALMLKDKRFKEIAKRTLVLQFITGGISCIAAYYGAGVYALLISPIITSIGIYFYNIHFYPVRLVKLRKGPINKIASFSFFQFAFSVSNYFTRNLDKLIIGKYFSLGELGYYEKSYRLMMLPLQQVTHVITPVMHPVLAQLQDDYTALARNYRKILALLSVVSFPLGTFLYFASDNLIFIVYGAQWMPAVPVFEILCVSVPLQMLISTTGGIYQASGRTDWLFYAGTFHSVITVLGFIIAAILFKSIESMAWAFVITLCTHTFLTLIVIYTIILKESVLPVFRDMIIPVLNAGILILIYIVIDYFIESHLLSLALQTIFLFVVSLPVLHITGRINVIQLYTSIVSKLKKNDKEDNR